MAVRDVNSGVDCVLLAIFSRVIQITFAFCIVFHLKYTYLRQNHAT